MSTYYSRQNLRRPYLTYLILGINVGVYLYMIFKYGTTENSLVLLDMGANFTPFVIDGGQWWRLITAAFIHIGFEHLLFNGLSIYFLGQDVERILGPLKFLFVYLIGAIGGNLFSLAFSINISAGASTGIFALFAAYIVLGRLNPQSGILTSRAASYTLLLVINFINGLFTQGVDNWGHFGGVVFGALATLVVSFSRSYEIKKIYRVGALLVILILAVLLILYAKFILLA